MNKCQVYKDLIKEINGKTVKKNIPMKEYTSFKIGGLVDILIEPENEFQIVDIVRYLFKNEIPYMVLGNGSNVIVRDGGFRGVMIVTGKNINRLKMVEEDVVSAQSGILLSTLAKKMAKKGLSGMEFASGIPGSLGGAVFMNAGAYGGEIKDILDSVRVYDPELDDYERISVEGMDLSYRHSIFQSSKKIILDVLLKLKIGDSDKITDEINMLAKMRNMKQPVNLPSAGSFFKRPDGYYAGKLIEDSGLKGKKIGGAQVSELHSGFIVNTGDATSRDIEDLMKIIQTTVYEKYKVKLEPEVRIVGEYQ